MRRTACHPLRFAWHILAGDNRPAHGSTQIIPMPFFDLVTTTGDVRNNRDRLCCLQLNAAVQKNLSVVVKKPGVVSGLFSLP
jgi:hypothetical protein